MSSCAPETAETAETPEAAGIAQAVDHEARSESAPARDRHPVVTALALSAGTAALVGAEFIPAGVLPGMAADLGVTEGRAGLTVAATALAGALTAPTIASLLPRADRRSVLLSLLVLAILSNLVVASAPSLGIVLAARVLLGIAIAGFWSFALSVGVHVTGRAALVSTTVALGTSTATIIGVPVSSVLGDIIGWRAVFLLISALTLVAGGVLWRLLPPVPAQPGAGLAMMRRVLGNRRLVIGVVVIFAAAFANFTAYPYIRVAIEAIDASVVSVLLLAWGLGGLVGNLAGGALSRWLRWAAAVGPAVLAVSLAFMASTEQTTVLALAVVLWGIGFNMVPVTTQLWVSAIEPSRVESAVALQVTAFQVAIMSGAVVGGLLVDHQGPAAAMLLGACVGALAAVGFASIAVRPRAA
ncbi:MFS transporter [Brachybacterium sacelli]|uniref:DHA1 family purine ribonucleoside efflux pump-like MFS transporter n=1 Tax=Brachybacterium sacelli TaxID=173364 RepID=A0ABS4X0A3_9MICO|nr:MFS transporter [Brachybacterium sacelli]MBP2381159.1 DHA1 family purine ribonucleoside efflux pump-like MFS transporter [Brachybacterium sacelli]